MNIIKFFNQTIDYIETTLEDKIDEKKIVQLSDIHILCSVEFFLY